MKVVVLTTSYPRFAGDHAGRFVADAVERLRERGVEVDVVSPATFRHFGIAYGDGIIANLRRRPWLTAALPLFLFAFSRAARRASRDADVVHAHWLPSGAVGLSTGKPLVLQVWGTDVELAGRVPWLAARLLRGARAVVAPSTALAEQVCRIVPGLDVVVIPGGVDLPAETPAEGGSPSILFAGRLSAEKGIRELLRASEGLPLVIVGDGPLRDHVPGGRGFVSHNELERLYGEAAVVAVPSLREGFGVVCAEAMAHGRPVVASAVGGLLDLVVDGETGFLVPPGDVSALRGALQRLLDDPELRARLGAAGRRRVSERFAWPAVTDAMLRLYERVVRPRRRS